MTLGPKIQLPKQSARIENWRHDKFNNCLEGEVYGHFWLQAGAYVQTTRLVDLDEANGKAETENTMYTLGKKRDI